ncbi:serine O-acetyltransferase, partial [Fischerella thermalis CCMEE 5273]
DVPPHSTVVGVPGRVVVQDGIRVSDRTDLDQVNLPDPVAETLRSYQQALDRLNQKVQDLERELKIVREEQESDVLTRVQHSDPKA